MEPLTSALLFPETEPSIHDIGKLLFFFNSLSYYMPTESDDEGTDQNLFKNLCTGYAPAPLHEDLTRFNRLLHEMENSRSDDLARLFSFAKSPITTGQIRDKDEASSGSVLSALQNDNGNKAYIEQKERLWQARLILKLAEMLDRRENEVRQGLTRITSDEQKIFASLEGAGETESKNLTQFSDQEKSTQLKNKVEYPADYYSSESAMLISLRVKAWAELFLADSSPDSPSIIVTTNPDSGSILLDGYENNWHKTPQKLFSLSIPTFSGLETGESSRKQYITTRNKLRLATKESLSHFESFLRQTAISQDTSSGNYPELGIQQKHVAAWKGKIKLEFPNPVKGYPKLDFYCFPGISPAALFQKTLNLEPLTVNEQRHKTAILAILHA